MDPPVPGSATAEVLGGRYQIEVCLGSGGMGSVWRAYDLRMRRHVAIKRLHRQEPDAAQRFEREMVALARLRHPNLVSVFDAGTTNQGDAYLVMELVRGVTLAERLRQAGRLPVEQAIHITSQIARGLSAAHAEGVVHRDLKPSNLMLSDDYDEPNLVKVVDFGVSRLVDVTQQSLSGAHFIGTPLYTSPEQAKGEEATPSSDLYCLGSVLYEMLVGHPPFRPETAMAVLFQHVHAVPPKPSLEHPDIPEWLDHLILQLLQKQPSSRPSAASVLASLGARQAVAPVGPSPGVNHLLESTADATPEGEPLLTPPRRGQPPAGALGSLHPVTAPHSLEPASGATLGDERPGFASRIVKALRERRLLRVMLAALIAPFLVRSAMVALRLGPAWKTPVSGSSAPRKPAPAGSQSVVPMVVDDFESADIRPAGKAFSLWEGFTYLSYVQASGSVSGTAFWKARALDSNRALRFGWRVVDPSNGKLDRPGVILQVRAANDFVDLSQHSRLLFSAKYAAAVGWPRRDSPLAPELTEALGDSLKTMPIERLELLDGEFSSASLDPCSHDSTGNPDVTFKCREYATQYTAHYEVSSDWKTIVIQFADLYEPPWSQTGVPREACLSVVDLIDFRAPVEIDTDGGCHSASMFFDDISIR